MTKYVDCQNNIYHCSQNNMNIAAYQQQAYQTFVIRSQFLEVSALKLLGQVYVLKFLGLV